jgi:predicted permease
MGLFKDIQFGLRMMRKSPGFTFVAILTLALGIGVNSTVFTLVNAALLGNLPFAKPEQIVGIRYEQGLVSYPDFAEFRSEAHSFSGIAAFSNLAADLSDQQSAAERVSGASISVNMFSMLGQKPLLGRDFIPEDEEPGAPPVTLLSYGLWQSRYGGDSGIVGRTIRINLRPHTVVGIMPEGEEFPQSTRLWVPIVRDPVQQTRSQRNLDMVARLADGAPLERAQAELNTIAGRLAAAYPETNKDLRPQVGPYADRGTGGPIRVMFLSMQAAVGFVLLIACANLANLLLSRAVYRTRETAIRTALGASRWRIARQLLVESVMLSFMGGLLGLLLAVFAVRWIDLAVTDTGKPYWILLQMDYAVFLHFLAVCLAAGLLFGLAPALQISKTRVSDNLKETGRGTVGSIRARRLSTGLLIGEIGLTIVLLTGAGLLVRSFLNMARFDIGVDTENLMTVAVQPAASRYPTPEDRIAFQQRLAERLNSLPGMDALTIASQPPAGGAAPKVLALADRNIADGQNRFPIVSRIVVVPGYFDALGLTLRQGRDFTAADGAPGGEVVIVNQPFAEQYFPGEDAVGRRIRLGNDIGRAADDPKALWLTVIAVSPPVFQQSPQNQLAVQPTVYVPYRQEPAVAFTVLARSRLQPESVIAALRNELRIVDPDLPLYNIRSLDEILARRRWPYRVFGSLFAAFGLIALLMSSIGIYGVTSYGVGQRTQEIGVRMALGATERHVLWLVLRQGVVRIATGIVIGLLASWGVSRVLGSLLVEVTPTDPVTFVAISILLSVVTLVACLLPARRAMRLDPVSALTAE